MSAMYAEHAEMLDLVATYALGAVSAEEARLVSAHLAVCDECRAEYDALRPAADALAYAVDDRLDAVNCPRMKANLMEAVSGALPSRPRRAKRGALAVVAALAIAAAFVLAFIAMNAQRHLGDLELAGARAYPVPYGEVLRTPQRVFIVMRNLESPPPGRVYQAWTLAPGAKTVAPSITFVPDAHGFVLVSLPEPAANVSAVAISVEPRGGSSAPTTKPLFVRPLS